MVETKGIGISLIMSTLVAPKSGWHDGTGVVEWGCFCHATVSVHPP